MHTDKDYDDFISIEIIELHRFFEDWFGGYCDDSDQVFAERLLDRMHEDFSIVLPGGIMLDGAGFLPEFRKLYGSNPGFHISIREVRQQPSVTDSVYTVTYQEWQRNAMQSIPENNGRLSSAILLTDEQAPNGFKWFHVHETWLPDPIIAVEPFNWIHS